MNIPIKLGFDEYMNKLKFKNPKKINWLIKQRINQDKGINFTNINKYILKTREEEENDEIKFLSNLRLSNFGNKKAQKSYDIKICDAGYMEEKIKEQQKILRYVLSDLISKFTEDNNKKWDLLESIEDYIRWEIISNENIVMKRRKQIANFNTRN